MSFCLTRQSSTHLSILALAIYLNMMGIFGGVSLADTNPITAGPVQPTTNPGGTGLDPVQGDLFKYEGKVVTLRSLTLVESKEVDGILHKLETTYEVAKYPWDKSFGLDPETSPWISKPEAGFREYYRHQLDGVVESFLRARVFEAFLTRYPETVDEYYDSTNLDVATHRQASILQKFIDITLRDEESKSSDNAYRENIKSVFPHMTWTEAQSTAAFGSIKRLAPYYRLSFECFPRDRNGETAPWFSGSIRASMLRYHIQAELKGNKAKYISGLEDEYGTQNYFQISGIHDAQLAPLETLLHSLGNENGQVALNGVSIANATFKKMGCPVDINVMFGSKVSLRKEWHLGQGNLAFEKFIEVAPARKTYIYLFQKVPLPHFREYPIEPGGFLYSFASRSLLMPIVKDIIAKMELGAGMHLRPPEEIVDGICAEVLFKTLYGEELPKVERK